MTYLAVPIAAKDLNRAIKQIKDAAGAGAEMLELRLDYLENLSIPLVNKLIGQAKELIKPNIPLLVTCRSKNQGGAIAYPDNLRVDILAAALEAGAAYIDFEYESFLASTKSQERIKRAISQKPNSRLILSAHNFQTKFDNIKRLYRRMQTVCPGAIPKFVYQANHINDCFDAFDFLRGTNGERIAFAMGNAGLSSRIIAKKLNSFITFASIDDKKATAPGQITIEKFKKLYRYDKINKDTEFYGIIGSPVAHSLSPLLHNTCFEKKKLNKLYLPLLIDGGIEEFARFLNNIINRPWLDFRGFSVTIPHKTNALEYLKAKAAAIEPLAERIGAVNTITLNRDGRLRGYNTDYTGAMKAITSAMRIKSTSLKNKSVAIVGAGGVARAIVAGLADAGAKIKIYNRTISKAEQLAAEFSCDFAGLDDLPNAEAKLLINCTSLGMYPDTKATAVPKKCLKKNMTVFDTIYNPAETLLLKQAKKVGAKTIDGISMFIHQAAEQFELFTGKTPTPKIMREIVSKSLSQK